MMRFTAPTCNHAPALGPRATTPEPGHERTQNDAEHDDCSHPEEGEANYKSFILKHADVSSAPRRTELEGHASKQDEPTDAENKVELEKPLKDSWRDSPKYREHYQRNDKLHSLLPEGPVELRRLPPSTLGRTFSILPSPCGRFLCRTLLRWARPSRWSLPWG